MARKLNPEDRERLIDEMLERVLDIVADKGGEDYLRSWWHVGRKGYDTMSDEELLREATDCLGFDLDGPEIADLEVKEESTRHPNRFFTKPPGSDQERLAGAYADQDALAEDNKKLRAIVLELEGALDELLRTRERQGRTDQQCDEASDRVWARAITALRFKSQTMPRPSSS